MYFIHIFYVSKLLKQRMCDILKKVRDKGREGKWNKQLLQLQLLL